jgi:hypothetical protein
MISMEEVMQTRVKLLSSTALAAAAVAIAAPSAFAAQHTSLEKRVEALEKAGGQNVTRTKKTMSLVISGHINEAINMFDNGTTSEFIVGTSNFSRTRVRWIGTGKINDDLSVKTHIELGSSSALLTSQAIGSNGDVAIADVAGGPALDERHIEFQVTSKTLGKIYMGQGSTGSESTSEVDLSGTAVITLNGNGELIGAGETWQRANAGAGLGTLGGVFNNFDGFGRRDRIRYDTPKFAGFQVTTSKMNGDSWDVALRYAGEFGGVKIAGAVAYADDESRNGRSFVNGSLSVLLPFGLSLTVGAADQDEDDVPSGAVQDDAQWRYAKIGYKFKALELGETRLAVEWSNNEDLRAAGDDATYIAGAVVQIIEPLGAELYFRYANFSLDVAGAADPDDIDIVSLGARFKF